MKAEVCTSCTLVMGYMLPKAYIKIMG
jgi:hypothetical protein